jgi:hypothetical protein
MQAERKITNLSVKHSFTLYPSLSPYRQTESQTEEQIHLLRVGWRNFFFQLCHCVSFLVMAGNSFRCYWPTIPVVPLCLFLVAVRNSFGLHRSVFWLWRGCYLLTYHTSCAVVSVFWLRREIVIGCTVYKKDSYSLSLIERESASKCVYFVRSNILLLCNSLLCVYLLGTVHIHRLTD